MSNKNIIIISVAVVVLLVAYFVFALSSKKDTVPVISNFEECVVAGNPIMETYPEQCVTEDGRVFVRKIDDSETSQIDDSIVLPFDPTEELTPEEVVSEILARSAELADLSESDVEVVSVVKKDWPDGCLGLGGSDEMCAQVIIPGYEVNVLISGESVQFRTNLDASVIRRE